MQILRWFMSRPIIAAWAIAGLAIVLNLNAGGGNSHKEDKHIASVEATTNADYVSPSTEKGTQATAAETTTAHVPAISHTIAPVAPTAPAAPTVADTTPVVPASVVAAPASASSATDGHKAVAAPTTKTTPKMPTAPTAPPIPATPTTPVPVATTSSAAPTATLPVETAPVATASNVAAPIATVPVVTEPTTSEPVVTAPVATVPTTTAPVAATTVVTAAPTASATHALSPSLAGKTPAELLRYARMAFSQKAMGQSVAIYQHLIKQQPNVLEYKGELGNVFYHQNKPKEAAALYADIALPLIKQGKGAQVSNMLGFIGAFYPEKATAISKHLMAK